MKKLTRRDRCYRLALYTRRQIAAPQAAAAWYHLADQLEALADRDLPKFEDLLFAIKTAAKSAKAIRRSANDRPCVV